MHEGYDEAKLVRAAQGGDRGAFGQLYEANVDRVYNYLSARWPNVPTLRISPPRFSFAPWARCQHMRPEGPPRCLVISDSP